MKAVKVVADAEHLLFWISFPGDLSILQPGGHLEQTVGRSQELLRHSVVGAPAAPVDRLSDFIHRVCPNHSGFYTVP